MRDFEEVHGGILLLRCRDEHVLAEIGEERQCLHTLMLQQTVKREVPPFEHAPVHWRPLGKDDVAGLLPHRLEGQCVAPNDVPLKDESDGLPAFTVGVVLKQRGVENAVKDAVQPFAALPDVVVENVNTVDRGHREHGVALEVELRLSVAFLDNSQLSFQNYSNEVPIAASGFEETGVDPFRLLLHEIKHGIDLATAGQHLAMIRDPLLRYDMRPFHRISRLIVFALTDMASLFLPVSLSCFQSQSRKRVCACHSNSRRLGRELWSGGRLMAWRSS